MQIPSARPLLVVLEVLGVLGAVACSGKDPGTTGDTAAGTTAADTTSTTGAGTTSTEATTTGEATTSGDTTSGDTTTSGTTTAADPELYCAMFKTAEACNAAAASSSTPCSWRTFIAVQREGDLCVNMPPIERCGADAGNTTDPGCAGPIAGCEGDFSVPHYRAVDEETVMLIDQCGGSPPIGYAPCNSGLADQAMPPECACVCELEP